MDAFDDIPGTTVFTAARSRAGFHLNQFCMSLMKAENRIAFKADEDACLAKWPMTAEQRTAVRARDYNERILLGGNIYFLSKIGATDGRSFQQLAAQMSGVSTYIARYDDLVDGREVPIDVSTIDVSMNGVELQDREFIAAIREDREPNASVRQVLPAYRTLDRLEKSLC